MNCTDFLDRLEGVLSILEPPALPPLDSDDLLDALEKDKKATQSGLIWVLPMRPGDVDLVSDLPRAEVRSEIDAFLVDSRA